MDYFRISQDKRYLHAPVISNATDIIQRRMDISVKNKEKIPDINIGFSNIKSEVDFLDVLDTQLYMVSKQVKDVFAVYEPQLIFKDICILNNFTKEYGQYYIPLFNECSCISDQSVVSPDRTCVEKLVMNQPGDDDSIFKVSGLLTDIVIIRLDVAESLLRRNIRKFRLEKISIVKEEYAW